MLFSNFEKKKRNLKTDSRLLRREREMDFLFSSYERRKRILSKGLQFREKKEKSNIPIPNFERRKRKGLSTFVILCQQYAYNHIWLCLETTLLKYLLFLLLMITCIYIYIVNRKTLPAWGGKVSKQKTKIVLKPGMHWETLWNMQNEKLEQIAKERSASISWSWFSRISASVALVHQQFQCIISRSGVSAGSGGKWCGAGALGMSDPVMES